MAPSIKPLAQSESKARFFSRMGWEEDDTAHRQLYDMMRMEAAEGRSRLVANQSDNVAHVDSFAWNDEVTRIYHRARPETRQFYDLGRDLDRNEGENWIIRWMLWHVFRYRDYRNNNHRNHKAMGPKSSPTENVCFASDEGPVQPVADVRPVEDEIPEYETANQLNAGHFWDPVRGNWQDN